MQEFERKPQTVEAERFTGGQESQASIQEWLGQWGADVEWRAEPTDYGFLETLTIQTMAGIMMVGVGEWVIRDKLNNLRGMHHDDFLTTYEADEFDV